MNSIGPTLTPSIINVEIARILHSDEYTRASSTPINFDVTLSTQRQPIGWLTVPTADIGRRFLEEYGDPNPRKTLLRIKFKLSNRVPNAKLLDRIRRLPYIDPRVLQEENHRAERRVLEVQNCEVAIKAIQFGRECRDRVFSVEWEEACTGKLVLDPEKGDFRVKVTSLMETRVLVVRPAQIYYTSAGVDMRGAAIIYLSLNHAPSFETESSLQTMFAGMSTRGNRSKPMRKRNISFCDAHTPFAPYVSLNIRLVCNDHSDIQAYHFLCRRARVLVQQFLHEIEYRSLFSEGMRHRFTREVSRFSWRIAFQVEALSRINVLDLPEVLSLFDRIRRTIKLHGVGDTAVFLKDFNGAVKGLLWYTDNTTTMEILEIRHLYDDYERKFFAHKKIDTTNYSADLTQCFHAVVTPTTIFLEGPFPERSNRVIRTYLDNQASFLRVSFVDENGLQYRFDRDIDGRDFIRKRVLTLLHDGFHIAGRHFEFLAYSQSALKEHAVWFVKPFNDPSHGLVNAATIIASLGSFRELAYDPTLIRCPARYGARISQAFTATDSSLSIEAEEIFKEDDIERNGHCFTDGVGTISPDLARAIHAALRKKKGLLGRRTKTYPKAFQIRFQGSKGMLSVNHRLDGDSVVIRPSMIKFDAPHSNDIEIARVFDKPGRFFLNRPLIMLLEGLGVPFEVFEKLQDDAVRNVHASVESMERAARLLESYGLGASFRLTSVMLSLHKLGVKPLEDVFWQQMMDFAVNHVLRELKHHARIPVPGGYNLVGVADIHGFLKEGEVFVCIDDPSGGVTCFSGPVMISRSPTIHPGDVQLVRAIGRPPPGSPFEREQLRNCVVFSTLGLFYFSNFISASRRR